LLDELPQALFNVHTIHKDALVDVPAATGDLFTATVTVKGALAGAIARRVLAVGPIMLADVAPALPTSNEGDVIEGSLKESSAAAGADQA
jgi:hypothetical protein